MEPYKMPEVARTIASIPVVQCPRCGCKDRVEYVDDTEWDKEQFECKDCGLEFVVGFEREIEYIWWKDDQEKQHEIWDTTRLVDLQAHELREVCEKIYHASGGKRPEGIDEKNWSRVCNAMKAIQHAMSHPRHTFATKEGQP